MRHLFIAVFFLCLPQVAPCQWENIGPVEVSRFSRIVVTDSAIVVLESSSGGALFNRLFLSRDGGCNWTAIGGEYVTDLVATENIIISSGHAGIRVSEDHGKSWVKSGLGEGREHHQIYLYVAGKSVFAGTEYALYRCENIHEKIKWDRIGEAGSTSMQQVGDNYFMINHHEHEIAHEYFILKSKTLYVSGRALISWKMIPLREVAFRNYGIESIAEEDGRMHVKMLSSEKPIPQMAVNSSKGLYEARGTELLFTPRNAKPIPVLPGQALDGFTLHDGHIYATSAANIFKVNTETGKVHPLRFALATAKISSMIAHNDKLLVSTSSQTLEYSPRDSRWQSIPVTWSVPKQMVSLNAQLLGSTDGHGLVRYDGRTWNRIETKTSLDSDMPHLYVHENKVYAVFGSIRVSEDEGRTWKHVSNAMTTNGIIWYFAIDGDYMLASGYSGLYVSRDKGTTWAATNAFRGKEARFLQVYNGLWTIEVGGVTYCSKDKGKTWTDEKILPVSPAAHYINQQGTILLSNGKEIKYSRDSGKTWKVVPMNGGPTSITCLEILQGHLYVGTYGHGIFRIKL